VNTLTIYRFKSNHWANSVSLSSGAACWSRTDAAPVTVMTVPTPMFVVQIKSASLQPYGGAGSYRRMVPAAPAPPTPPPSPAPEAEAEPAQPETVAADEAETVPETPSADSGRRSSGANARIELIIDSLPHQSLIQSIPVTVEPLGDKIFTATVASLNITATGASVGETLLLLKDHIESIYNELNDKPHLDDDQRKVQELLDTYIAKSHKYVTKESKKSDWFRR
jgi:hypothetical protein